MTDQRLEKALEFANYRQTLANQKQILKDRCASQLNYAYNGGLFTIDNALISFIGIFVNKGKKSMVVLDSNNSPIDIENLEEFFEHITSRYFESVNEYHRQDQDLAHKRKTVKLVEWGIDVKRHSNICTQQ